jgi:SAM-dependent methyltransferase
VPTRYDEIAYPSFSFAQTHPDRLGAIAALYGLSPAPVERCRVLELGCGNGSNLIPMAFCLPESRFVGVDLAASQIQAGLARAAGLGLRNIELRCADLMEITPELGQFDYLIAHGLYSWVPPQVREKIFAIGRENLAPHGVAYVSYNTFPGGHLRRMVREILLYHVRGILDPAERIRESLALARHISNWKHEKDNERDLLRAEFARLLQYDPHHFYHDDLADYNSPVYFHEFMEQAARHGLQYLAEADFYEMQAPPPVVGEQDPPRLPSPEDRIEFEQYLDFLRCRRFRQTLLCRAGVAVERSACPSRLWGLYLSSPLRAASENPDLGPGKIERFVGPKDSQVETDFPAAKAALLLLAEAYPRALRFEDLLKRSRALAAAGQTDGDDWPAQIADGLARLLLRLYAVNAVEVSAGAPRFTVELSAHPAVSRLVREQLTSGQVVVNQLHRQVEIRDEKARHLLQLADGTRDLAALRRELAARVGVEIGEDALRQNLSSAARCALLVG